MPFTDEEWTHSGITAEELEAYIADKNARQATPELPGIPWPEMLANANPLGMDDFELEEYAKTGRFPRRLLKELHAKCGYTEREVTNMDCSKMDYLPLPTMYATENARTDDGLLIPPKIIHTDEHAPVSLGGDSGGFKAKQEEDDEWLKKRRKAHLDGLKSHPML
jgi:hypothetical protein